MINTTAVYRCHNCKLYIAKSMTCQLMIPEMQGKIAPDDYCTHHKPEVHRCEYCGNGTLVPFIEVHGKETHIYCKNCVLIKSMQNMPPDQESPNPTNPSE